jgi:hypothetical protein
MIKRDSTVLDTLLLTTTDTTITDTGLLPSHTYTYTAQLLNSSTTQVQARTMDTTSHNWSFQQFVLGDGSRGSSTLYDVAIINDTLAYAVGEIYLKDSYTYDSLGNWIDPYNIAKWNGNSWELMRVRYNFQLLFPNGTPGMLYTKVTAIYAFSANDIWIAAGTVQHYNGHTWIEYAGNGAGSANKIWGSDSSNLYFVCNGGTIIHYNGTSWTKIESGTTLDVHDIYGAYNASSKQWEILAIASNSQTTENALLQINSNNTVTQLNTSGLSAFSTGIWFAPQQQYYVVGSGIHQKSLLSNPTWTVYASGEVTSYASSAIRGQGINDVFVVGSFHEVVHYNGSTWYNYKSEIPYSSGGAFGSVVIKGNTAIIVGYDGAQAVTLIGKR